MELKNLHKVNVTVQIEMNLFQLRLNKKRNASLGFIVRKLLDHIMSDIVYWKVDLLIKGKNFNQ